MEAGSVTSGSRNGVSLDFDPPISSYGAVKEPKSEEPYKTAENFAEVVFEAVDVVVDQNKSLLKIAGERARDFTVGAVGVGLKVAGGMFNALTGLRDLWEGLKGDVLANDKLAPRTLLSATKSVLQMGAAELAATGIVGAAAGSISGVLAMGAAPATLVIIGAAGGAYLAGKAVDMAVTKIGTYLLDIK